MTVLFVRSLNYKIIIDIHQGHMWPRGGMGGGEVTCDLWHFTLHGHVNLHLNVAVNWMSINIEGVAIYPGILS